MGYSGLLTGCHSITVCTVEEMTGRGAQCSRAGLAAAGLESGPAEEVTAPCVCPQVSEMEVNGQFESVCESVFSELESQAVEALDLPVPGCFRVRSHSYVRAIEKGCSQDDECVSLRSSSPPRTTTTVRTIQSSTGEWAGGCPGPPRPRQSATQARRQRGLAARPASGHIHTPSLNPLWYQERKLQLQVQQRQPGGRVGGALSMSQRTHPTSSFWGVWNQALTFRGLTPTWIRHPIIVDCHRIGMLF